MSLAKRIGLVLLLIIVISFFRVPQIQAACSFDQYGNCGGSCTYGTCQQVGSSCTCVTTCVATGGGRTCEAEQSCTAVGLCNGGNYACYPGTICCRPCPPTNTPTPKPGPTSTPVPVCNITCLQSEQPTDCSTRPECNTGSCFPVCNYCTGVWACTAGGSSCNTLCDLWSNWTCTQDGVTETRYCISPQICSQVAQARQPCSGTTPTPTPQPGAPPPATPGGL